MVISANTVLHLVKIKELASARKEHKSA